MLKEEEEENPSEKQKNLETVFEEVSTLQRDIDTFLSQCSFARTDRKDSGFNPAFHTQEKGMGNTDANYAAKYRSRGS